MTLDIESQTADTIPTVLFIGHPSPNLAQVRHTFRRQGSAWTLLRREEGPGDQDLNGSVLKCIPLCLSVPSVVDPKRPAVHTVVFTTEATEEHRGLKIISLRPFCARRDA